MPNLNPKNSTFKSNRFDRRRLMPENEYKPIKIINDSLYSVHLPGAEFTNFLSKSNKDEFEGWMLDFTNNPDRAYEYTLNDESDSLEKEIKNILESCHPGLELDQVEFIMKTRWTTLLDQTTPLRLYFILSDDNQTFDLVLVDPLHLSIPSRVQRQNNTYKNNKSNNICISTSIKHMKNHLYIKRKNILNTIDIK